MDWFNGQTVSVILFFIGVYSLIANKNIIKTVISIGIMEVAVVLQFISINYREGSIPPIGKNIDGVISDPLPQALMITAIVIGVSTTAVALTMFISMYHKYGTTNWSELTQKRMEQD